MRHIYRISIIFAALLIAVPSLAGCPLFGVYTTVGGDMLAGRASESWPTGAAGQIGNTVKAVSWDGAAQATQWELNCTSICADPELILDTVDGTGTGQRVYLTQYCGGQIRLVGTGNAWYDGDAFYTADVLDALFTTTIDIELGVPVARNTEIHIEADVLDCTGVCLILDIALATELGQDEGANFPGNYPLPAEPPLCSEDPLLFGSWWDVTDIVLAIEGCSVPVEDNTFSGVKSLYR
jgi:hypothetical protein